MKCCLVYIELPSDTGLLETKILRSDDIEPKLKV